MIFSVISVFVRKYPSFFICNSGLRFFGQISQICRTSLHPRSHVYLVRERLAHGSREKLSSDLLSLYWTPFQIIQGWVQLAHWKRTERVFFSEVLQTVKAQLHHGGTSESMPFWEEGRGTAAWQVMRSLRGPSQWVRSSVLWLHAWRALGNSLNSLLRTIKGRWCRNATQAGCSRSQQSPALLIA